MKKLKYLVSGILLASMVLSIAGCGENATEEPERTTNAEYQALIDAVGGLQDKVDSSIQVTKKISWLAWWAIDETQGAAELFKLVYGVPEAGDTSYGDDADHIFQYNYCTYEDRYDKLATMISGGDSPDIFQFEILNYPYAVYKGMFQSIDGVVDTNTEAWSSMRDEMDQFMWGGKNYCALTSVNLDQVLWYRRSVCEEAGLQDPYELYKAGNWNWDTFLDMCDKFQQSGEGKYATDGFQVPDKLVITTGVPFVSLKDGKLTSNLHDANIERAMNSLIDVMYKEDYRYPRDVLNGWACSYKAWMTGDTLFFGDGTWRWDETFSNYTEKLKWDENDVWFVPYPKDPNTDVYYQSMKNDSYMLCGGSDNLEGFKAWTECLLATANDEKTINTTREKRKIDYGWTDEMLDFEYELTHGALTAVFDFKAGIGQDVVDSSTVYNPMDCLTQIPYLNCLDSEGNACTFVSLRAANEGQLQARIDELNATIGQ